MAFPTHDAPCIMTPKHTPHSTTSSLVGKVLDDVSLPHLGLASPQHQHVALCVKGRSVTTRRSSTHHGYEGAVASSPHLADNASSRCVVAECTIGRYCSAYLVILQMWSFVVARSHWLDSVNQAHGGVTATSNNQTSHVIVVPFRCVHQDK